eukprot:2403464-Rhodomonas_salina.1
MPLSNAQTIRQNVDPAAPFGVSRTHDPVLIVIPGGAARQDGGDQEHAAGSVCASGIRRTPRVWTTLCTTKTRVCALKRGVAGPVRPVPALHAAPGEVEPDSGGGKGGREWQRRGQREEERGQ